MERGAPAQVDGLTAAIAGVTFGDGNGNRARPALSLPAQLRKQGGTAHDFVRLQLL